MHRPWPPNMRRARDRAERRQQFQAVVDECLSCGHRRVGMAAMALQCRHCRRTMRASDAPWRFLQDVIRAHARQAQRCAASCRPSAWPCPTATSARCTCRKCCACGWSAAASSTIGAYWPIKGEFDALPALFRWSEAEAEPAHRPAGDRPRDQAAALSRLVPRLPDGGRRLRHPQAEGHRGLRAATAAGALRRLRPERPAPGLRRRLLRPHAGGACSRGPLPSAWATRTASCPGSKASRTTCRSTPC